MLTDIFQVLFVFEKWYDLNKDLLVLMTSYIISWCLNVYGSDFVFYNMTVFASTVKGDGPDCTPVLVVRTDQDSEYFM